MTQTLTSDMQAMKTMMTDAYLCRKAEGIVDAYADAQYQRRVIQNDWTGLVAGFRPDSLTRSERIESGEIQQTRNSSPGMVNPNSRPVKKASEKVCANIRKSMRTKVDAEIAVNLVLDVHKTNNLEDLPMGVALDLMKSLWNLRDRPYESVPVASVETASVQTTPVARSESVSSAPKKAERVHPTEEGCYWLTRNGDRIPVNVSRSKSSGYLFAELWNGQSFVYEKGLIFKLDASDMMTLDEAQEFGKKYGRCMRCKRTLTKKASIDAGIGPVCASKF